MEQCSDVRLEEIAKYVRQLLTAPSHPPLPKGLEGAGELREVSEYIIQLRETLGRFARGDFSQDLLLRGVMAGSLKALQANLRHLTWQVEQVAQGDFSQRTDFLTGFSESFNHMVAQLDAARNELTAKKQELLDLTEELRHEVMQRETTLQALRESENKFKYLAEHDPLTGILNRRSFFELAERALSHGWTQKYDCGIALIDVDNFKNFNDTYGHQIGDTALKHVVSCSQRTLRQDDLLGRYGGEEFVFLFSRVNREQAKMAAERICSAVADAPLEIGGIEICLTVSVGVALVGEHETQTPINRLMQGAVGHADEALYESKRNGKNRVTLWGDASK